MVHTAYPTASDIFQSSKSRLEVQARRSLLPRFSGKKHTSFGFELWKMALQMGLAVTDWLQVACVAHMV